MNKPSKFAKFFLSCLIFVLGIFSGFYLGALAPDKSFTSMMTFGMVLFLVIVEIIRIIISITKL